MLISACIYFWCQTESGTFSVPVSYVCVHCQISASALGSLWVQSEKRGNARAYMCTEEQGISCVRSVEGRNALSLPCEIHRPFLLVSPSTVGDFPNCKSSPFIVPTNSGWQRSLHCHTPHYNRPTLLQLLSVRVYLCLQNVFIPLSYPWIVSRENKQNTAKQNSFVKKYCLFQQIQYIAKTKVNISSKLSCTRN